MIMLCLAWAGMKTSVKMAANSFTFKRFSVIQDHAAMKVSTDSVLLGAWVEPPLTGNILDIGSGTGILALMLAQRTDTVIVAVEPDKGSFADLVRNIAESPWPDQIIARNETLAQFCSDITHFGSFDLIICNPPFFENAVLSDDPVVSSVRHSISMTHGSLIHSVAKLLRDKGSFGVILPEEVSERFIFLASQQGMYCNRWTDVHATAEKPVTRRLMIFEKQKKNLLRTTLFIKKGDAYSSEYIALLKAYYLSF